MAVRHRKADSRKRQPDRRPRELPRAARNRSITVGIYLLLTGLSLAVFSQTIRYDFVNFDDDMYVYNAPTIRAGLTLQGIVAAFTSPHARNWHPLTTLSHMLDCRFYGLNAGGHHATNLVLHTIAALLLFRVLRQMTGALWKSAIVAALFAVHPLHVESVAWVSERKDVLSAVFFFLTLGAYVHYAQSRSIMRYLLVTVLFVAGLMAKSMLVTAPVVLILLDYWPLNRIRGQQADVGRPLLELVIEKIPLFVLSAGACVITFVLQKRATGAIPPLPLLWRLENALASYVIYIWKTLWPTRLGVFYPHPNNTLSIGQVIFAVALLVAVTAAAAIFRSQRPYLLTGWFWYVVTLFPVIGVIQVGEQGHADRYTYLPSIGLFLAAVWFTADIAKVRGSRSRLVVATAVTMVLPVLAWTAFVQTSYWRNS